MLKIGLTGGIGSGKTTVCKIFELLGIPVFYADEEAKNLMVRNPDVIKKIKTEFGKDAYLPDLSLNRKYISDLVFKDNTKLSALNNIVHPAVFEAFKDWAALQNAPYVLKEAAILFESKSNLLNHYNILVSSPLALRIRRVMKRDDIAEEKVLERISKQMPEQEKEKLADYIIHNNEQDFLILQVLALHDQLLRLKP